jgi:hypothetical protein
MTPPHPQPYEMHLFTNRNCLIFDKKGEQIPEYQRAISCSSLDKELALKVTNESQKFFIAKWREWEHEIHCEEMQWLLGVHPDYQSSAPTEREKVLDCRQEVKDFAVLMEQKLRKNDHKTHWKNCNQEYLLTRLDEEVKELRDCFFIYSPCDMNFLMDGQHEDRIPDEAVDVANFAMMLWDNFGDRELRQQGERDRE